MGGLPRPRIYLKDLKLQLLHSLAQVGFPVDAMTLIGSLLENHDTYRNKFGWPQKPSDTAWLGVQSPPITSALLAVVDIIYTPSYNDHFLKYVGEKTAAEILACEPFSSVLDRLKDEFTVWRDTKVANDDARRAIEDVTSMNPTSKGSVHEPRPATLESVQKSLRLGENILDTIPEMHDIDPNRKLEEYYKFAASLWQIYCTFVAQPPSKDGWKDLLRAHPINAMHGQTEEHPGYVGIIYDTKQTGETVTCPHLRVPGLRENGHLGNMISGTVQARSSDGAPSTNSGDIYFMFDGGKHGNEGQLLAGFKDATTKKKLEFEKLQNYLMYEELLFSVACLVVIV